MRAARLQIGGAKQRALLAALLLHANEVVPGDRLIDELWGEDSPENAATALRVNVSRLRKALPPDALVDPVARLHDPRSSRSSSTSTASSGWSTRRGAASRDGSPADASERLREALALWRGPALADVSYESFAQAAIARLEEIRLAALELRIEADLALGRDRELVGELEALVAEHPLRERLRGYLMLALYRSGRQAEALNAYQEARRILVDELGIDPSPSLQELERAILRQDPALDLPAAAATQSSGSAERSILVAVPDQSHLDALIAVAEPLARRPARSMILARLVPDADGLGPAAAWLDEIRSALEARGVAARTASFTSSSLGAELARLASELDVDLLLADAPDGAAGRGSSGRGARHGACRHAVRRSAARAEGGTAEGAVLVPFGGADHDWAAVELGAWLARAAGVPLRLAGAGAAPDRDERDASRLLSHCVARRSAGARASLPSRCSSPPGEEGMLEASRDAGLLVVGLSTRWQREGLGAARLRLAREAPPPTLLVRRACARAVSLRPPPSRASRGRSAPSPALALSAAGRLVGPAGKEMLPLLARQRAVRDRAGAPLPRAAGRCPRRAPRPSPCVCSRRRPSGDTSMCVLRFPAVSVGPICVPWRRPRATATGSKPETARSRPSGLKSSVSTPAPPWSSLRTSSPVRTSQRRTSGSRPAVASVPPSGLNATA